MFICLRLGKSKTKNSDRPVYVLVMITTSSYVTSSVICASDPCVLLVARDGDDQVMQTSHRGEFMSKGPELSITDREMTLRSILVPICWASSS